MSGERNYPWSIVPLAEAAESIPFLARWQHAEWAGLNPGDTEAKRAERFYRQIESADLPQTWVVREGGDVLGSASLVRCDMDTHPEWEPWLASVFVAPEHRGKGVGRALVRRVEEEAAAREFERLYLFTTGQSLFYEKMHWDRVVEERYRGETVTVMRRELSRKPKLT